MSKNTSEICVIGLGPRGLSVLDRLCANAAGYLPEGHQLRVHLVDPHLLDGSRVWRVDQSKDLLMNTVSSQVTMFVDDSVECEGPSATGPSLYEWARFLTLVGLLDDVPAHVRAEAAELGPDDYPSRAFYGHYLNWVRDYLIRNAPADVHIEQHCQSAVDLTDAQDGQQVVTLASGERLAGLDAVVLTLGHSASRLRPAEAAKADHAARHDLVYVPPGNPADVDLDVIEPGQPTFLYGMGLNFFDYLALFTISRGGTFSRNPDGTLTYHRSGREPRLFAGSRRGVPHHARGENQKGPFGRHTPLFLTPGVIDELRAGGPADFIRDVWPLIDREVRSVYYATLVAQRRCSSDVELFLRQYVALGPAKADGALLALFGIDESDRWDWDRIARPYGDRTFGSRADFRAWLLPYLAEDVRQARLGNVDGPLKAALDVLRDLRNEIRLVVDHGGLSGESYRDELQHWYTPLNAFLSIGPPVERIEQMIALIEAEVLEVIGPQARVDEGFVARSPGIPDSAVPVTALVEARLPETDIHTTTDPLLRRLLQRGAATVYRIPSRGGGFHESGGLAVTRRPYHLLDTAHRPHQRRFAFGVPTETVHWVTAAGIRPGVNSVILGDADAVARAGLAVASRALSVSAP